MNPCSNTPNSLKQIRHGARETQKINYLTLFREHFIKPTWIFFERPDSFDELCSACHASLRKHQTLDCKFRRVPDCKTPGRNGFDGCVSKMPATTKPDVVFAPHKGRQNFLNATLRYFDSPKRSQTHQLSFRKFACGFLLQNNSFSEWALFATKVAKASDVLQKIRKLNHMHRGTQRSFQTPKLLIQE